MEFEKKIFLAQEFTLEAAFELLHWQHCELNLNIPIILAHRLMIKNNIHIFGVPNSGKSHIARLVNLLPNYTVTEVQIESGGNYLKLDGDGADTDVYEYRLEKAVTSEKMQIFWWCITAMRNLLNAQKTWQESNK